MDKPHPDAFVTSYRPEAGYREWMLLEPLPDGRMRSKVWREQLVPDNFWDQLRHVAQDLPCFTGNTQAHKVPVARIPDVLTNQWAEEDKDVDDPRDKQKRFIDRLNDSDYRKVRIGDKRL